MARDVRAATTTTATRVAWIDLMAEGRQLGRSVLTRGDHARFDELAAEAAGDPLRVRPAAARQRAAVVPRPGLINHADDPRVQRDVVPQGATPAARRDCSRSPRFFHPLDMVGSWNRALRAAGLRAVPVRGAVRRRGRAAPGGRAHRGHRAPPSFLAVLKRFGAATRRRSASPTRAGRWPLDMPGGDARAGRAVRTGSTTWCSTPAAASTSPRTPTPRPTPSAAATRGSTSGRRSATAVDPHGVWQSDLAPPAAPLPTDSRRTRHGERLRPTADHRRCSAARATSDWPSLARWSARSTADGRAGRAATRATASGRGG